MEQETPEPEMPDRQTPEPEKQSPKMRRPLRPHWAGAAAAGCFAGGALLLSGGTQSGVAAGILVAIVGLAALALSLGSPAHGPEVEGPLDLSSRIALGLLGGLLGGLAHGAVTWLAAGSGFLDLLGTSIDPRLDGSGWAVRALLGPVLGLIMGVWYGGIPGRNFISKAAMFASIPTLIAWVDYFPRQIGEGLLGLRLGLATPLVVLAGFVIAAVVVSSVLVWGDRTEYAPLSRPLVPR
ncbi:MAG: hypothetical protein ABFS14_03885 [Gemmatimonadota bacterium]